MPLLERGKREVVDGDHAGRIEAQHGFVLGDQTFAGHVDRDLERSRCRAFPVTGLQHVEMAVLDGELEILKVLWDLGEASVRQVHEQLGSDRGIVQSTVQAFLRTMETKGLVDHRAEGRTFLYRATRAREDAERGLVGGLLDRAFDGAIDQLVARAFDIKQPPKAALQQLRELLDQAEAREGDADREEQR